GCSIALDRLRTGAEIIFVQPPRDCAVVHGAAAGLVSVAERSQRRRPHVRIGAPSHWLPLDVRAQILALGIAQLILRREVPGREARAAFEPDDLYSGLAQLGRENASSRADAIDHH